MAKAEPDEAQGTVEPGLVTGILRQLAEAPEPAGDAWERGLRPGAVVGRFELVREIGRGAFGVVYEARDRELGRAVAFKAMRAGDRTALREERLLREAEAAARLSHPNVVTIHDVGRSEHGPYLVLELLRGQTLADRLGQGPSTLREALRVGVEIAKGLAHAHGAGVVHRDLKPANVFLCDDGQVKLLDFGLSHALGRRRIDGGTPAYMAPEQRRGAPEDERTDVFALGVILFRMVAGELPFRDAGARPVALAPGLEVPDLPALDAYVRRMLAADPVDRPRDGAEVLAALAAFQGELERSPSPGTGAVRARRRSPARAAALAGAALAAALLATAGLGLHRTFTAPHEPPLTVAVADFANQTGEPELDGLSGMLITSLEQSQRISVLTRVRMLDVLHQLGKQNVSSVDEALGREVALRAGVRALVLATIRRFDDLYAIELKALDPVTSEYLFTLQEQARGKASVPDVIDRLSEGTRERLRESRAEVAASRTSVARLTTGSLEAYQHYFRAERLKEAILYERAIEEYRRAIAIDPGFALAHYRIAYLGKFTGLDDGARRAEIDAAVRAIDRVPPKERLLVEAWKAVTDGRAGEATAMYARAVEAYPQDKEVLFMAGDQFVHRDEYERGLPFFERAVALDPTFEPALMHLADCLSMAGRNERLASVASEWVRRSPSAVAYRALSMGMAGSCRIDEAVDAARRALDLDGSAYSRATLGEALVLAGRYEEAEGVVRPAAARDASKLDRVFAIPVLACALGYQGRVREALRVADTLPDDLDASRGRAQGFRFALGIGWRASPSLLGDGRELARTARPDEAAGVAVGLVVAGDLETAAAVLPRLSREARSLYEAAIARRSGEPRRALALLREPATLPFYLRSATLWLRAASAYDAGEYRQAIAAADALRRTPGGAWRSWGVPRAELFAAAAHERLGERALARERVDALLGTLRRADPDLPILEEARALRARVAPVR